MTTDIDLNGSESFQWTPVGNYNPATTSGYFFGGYFDGDKHTIANLYIHTNTLIAVGLFGSIDGATIKNTGITGSGMLKTDSSNSADRSQYAGAIAGYTRTGCTIDNCYNRADSIIAFNKTNIMVVAFAGGILGYGDVGSSTSISNCYNLGNVSTQSILLAFSGGMVGRTNGSLHVVNCYNRGNVSQSSSTDYPGAGGIVGCVWRGSEIVITNCYNTGSIAANNIEYQGGISGQNLEVPSIDITNSYYLDSCGGSDTHGGISKTESEMKDAAFVTTLNNGQNPPAWGEDTQNSNEGYPVLLWREPSAIPPITPDNRITLFPNPVTNGQLNITCDRWQEGNKAEIYTMLGILVGSYRLTDRETAISVSHLSAGIYLVKVGLKSMKTVIYNR
jgi:hypothetical protein